MSHPRLPVLCVFAALLILASGVVCAAEPVIVQLDIRGPIGPATSEYVHNGLARARALHATLVVLRMDTPGGLVLAMRRIIRDILASPVPVAGFVAPGGARAASAGTYILYACNIAAMAPATNLGAATPVEIKLLPGSGAGASHGGAGSKASRSTVYPVVGTETRKIVNDAAAYIRALAQLRGRNAEWATEAVRGAVSLPAAEALKLHVIDLVARNVPDLLRRLNGRVVSVPGGSVRLDTAGAHVLRLEPDWRSRLLSVITDPSMAYVLILLGVYGLFFEMMHPGLVFPGVLGAISLILALFAFQVLPVSFAGLGLMLLGIGLMVAEVFVPAFGTLGLSGAAAFVIGSVMLLDTAASGFGPSWWLIGGMALLSAAFIMTVASLALRAHRRPVVSGREQMIGSAGEALAAFQKSGRVRVHGEEWQAHTSRPLVHGQKIKVVGMDGLVLIVEPYGEEVS